MYAPKHAHDAQPDLSIVPHADPELANMRDMLGDDYTHVTRIKRPHHFAFTCITHLTPERAAADLRGAGITAFRLIEKVDNDCWELKVQFNAPPPLLLPALVPSTQNMRDWKFRLRGELADGDWQSCLLHSALVMVDQAACELMNRAAARASGHKWIGQSVYITQTLAGQPAPRRNYTIIGVLGERVLIEHIAGGQSWLDYKTVAADVNHPCRAGGSAQLYTRRLLTRDAVERAVDSVFNPEDDTFTVSFKFDAWTRMIVLYFEDTQTGYKDLRVFNLDEPISGIKGACGIFKDNALFERDYQAAQQRTEAQKPKVPPQSPVLLRYKCQTVPVVDSRVMGGKVMVALNISTTGRAMLKWVALSDAEMDVITKEVA